MKHDSQDFHSLRAGNRLLITILLSLVFPISLSAQNRQLIKGTVSDEVGAKIPAARIILRSRSGIQIATFSDQGGAFEFVNLKVGSYLIQVKASGFSDYSSADFQLTRGETKDVSVKLAVATINASVVVTATGTLERADEAGKVISILDAQDIEARHEVSLAEALRGTPGVRVQQQGSPGSLTTLRLRGERSLDTAVLLDGLRVRDAGDINGSAVSLVTDLAPVALDRVEVLRGSGSSLYGTHAIGGVLNIIPEEGLGSFHLGGGFEAGSLGTYRERIQTTGGTSKLGFNIGVNRVDVRRGIDGADQYGDSAFTARTQLHLSPEVTLAATLYGTVANARTNDSPFALPAAFNGTFPGAIAGTTFQPDFNNPDQGRRHRMLVGAVRFSQVVNDRLSYSVAYQRVSSNRRNYNGARVDPRYVAFVPFGDFEFFSINRGDIDTVDSRVNISFSQTNMATGGFEFERESFFQSTQPSFTTFNNTTDRQRTFAVFGQDQLSFLNDRLRISIGARGQSYRLRAADRPGQLQSRKAESSVTGDAAIAYLVESSKTKLRAHVGNGFRAPSLFERFGEGLLAGAGSVRFGDPTLRAEQSISIDGGFDQRLAGDRIRFGATYFYTRLQRAIAFTGFASDPLGLGRFNGYVNRQGGLSRGAETFLDSVPVRGMEIRASYTFTNSDRSSPTQGLQPEYVIPRHLFSLAWQQRYRPFLFSLELNHTGSYLAPVFENNFPFGMAELRFSGYTKADFFGSYERGIGDGLRLVFFGGLENLLHQRYYENGFLAPRTVGRAGIKFDF